MERGAPSPGIRILTSKRPFEIVSENAPISNSHADLRERKRIMSPGEAVSNRVRVVLSVVQIVACVAATYSNPAVRLQERELIQHDDWWSIDIKYPIIEGANTFNTAVRQHINATADGFRKGLPRTASKGYPDYGAYLKGKYEAKILRNGVISVLFDYDEYAPGAAHPWGVIASINYDTRSGRLLAISDLFRPGCNYVSRLSEISIHELEQHEYAEEAAIRRGAGPVEKNFGVFTLTDTELVLHFQQYQVAAGAVPSEHVSIPLTKLAHLLRKEYLAVQ
jgi:Deacetylase PdaC/Protein of unknown function (DUF3298)